MAVLLEQTDITLEVSDLSERYDLGYELTADGKLCRAYRSSGVHLSGVLREIGMAIRVLAPGEPIEEDLPTICALGFMWEEFAASLYPSLVYQPGEVCVDGVWMTCDGVGTVLNEHGFEETCVEEFKFTQKKLLGPEEFMAGPKAWMWRAQGQGYCRGYEALLVRWHVMFVRGDYKSSGPVYRRYLVRFTPEEVERNWDMVLRNKERAVAE